MRMDLPLALSKVIEIVNIDGLQSQSGQRLREFGLEEEGMHAMVVDYIGRSHSCRQFSSYVARLAAHHKLVALVLFLLDEEAECFSDYSFRPSASEVPAAVNHVNATVETIDQSVELQQIVIL